LIDALVSLGMAASRFADLFDAVKAGRVDPEDGNPGIAELLGTFESGQLV
jgi:hypothetical protein